MASGVADASAHECAAWLAQAQLSSRATPLPGDPLVMRCVNPDVVDDHRYPGGGRGRRAAAEGCREATTHRQVKDNKEPMMQRIVPGSCIDLVGVYREEVDPVQVPADLLGRSAAVILHAVCVEPRLAA